MPAGLVTTQLLGSNATIARHSDGSSGTYLAMTTQGAAFANSTGPWTFCAWIKPDSIIGTPQLYIFESNKNLVGQFSIIYGYSAATVEVFNSPGDDFRTGSQIVLPNTNWHHIAYRKAATGTAAYDKFLDGVKTSINASFTGTINACTGDMAAYGTDTAANLFAGALFDVACVNTNLTDGQITSLAGGALFSSLGILGTLYNNWRMDGSSPEVDRGLGYSLVVNGTGFTTVAGP